MQFALFFYYDQSTDGKHACVLEMIEMLQWHAKYCSTVQANTPVPQQLMCSL